ncbi:MAG TPA: 4-hydroxythreonine-4-phosphate dehydrogenase PdxA [Burkholderiales bacterium]|nr:4-hydroxythreonine-4-phosphate dehydrogenase PdxA [Burkholderiales bacterium]
MSQRIPTVAFTPGEPAGIGPDLALSLADRRLPVRLVVFADRSLIHERARRMGKQVEVVDFLPGAPLQAGTLRIQHVPLAAAAQPGVLNPKNSGYVLECLRAAVAGCLQGAFDALVTGPIHKAVIVQAGFPFSGHTEYLAELTRAPHPVMMLVGGGLRVALATTHLPLQEVPAALTRETLERTLRVLHRDLAARFGIERPRILVAGLNPHAGESGYLGREEIEVIVPVLERLRDHGFALTGPLPADTLFQRGRLEDADCVLAMYHDQGLPVLKYASFGAGVNVTLGLPIIRTSVDHGTALELAGTGRAQCGSLLQAIGLAAELAKRVRA